MKKRFLAAIFSLFAVMLFAAAAGAASVSVSGATLNAEYSLCKHRNNYVRFEDGSTTIDKSKWNTDNVIRVTTKVSYGCQNDDCKIDKSDTVTLDFPVVSGDCHKKYEKTVSHDGVTFTLSSGADTLMGKTVFKPTNASCTSDGVKTQHAQCGGCGKYFTLDSSTGLPDKEITDRSPYIIQAPGHTFKRHDAVAATCTKSGNIEYWECTTCKRCYGDADGKNLLNYNTDIFTATNPKNHTGNISYVMGSVPEIHKGTYTCCGRSVDAEKHTYNSSGVCEKCSYSAPFRVRKGTSEWYCSSYDEAVGALANGADTVTFIKDYPDPFAINENCTLEVEKDVTVDGIIVKGKNVKIKSNGTVNTLSKTGGSLVLSPGNGVYKKITTTSGSVGDFLEGSYAYINTAEKKIYHSKDASGSEISGVIVKRPPIQYVEIKGAAETGDNAYSLTVKEGETVKLEANTYQLSFSVQAEKITTKWDCGSIPADNYTETIIGSGSRSTLTLTNLTPGTYTLSCSATESGYNYTVTASLTLTVEENGEIGGECTHEKDADGYCTVENCDHDESCCKKRDSRTEIFILEKDVKLQKPYDGTDSATIYHVYFVDKDGNSVSVLNDCYTVEAKYNSPNVSDASYVTGKITLTEKGAALYKLAKETFTYSGCSIYKAPAYPSISVNKINFEFTTEDKIIDYITLLGGVMENAEVRYYYTPYSGSATDPSLAASNTEITAETKFTENGTFYIFAKTSKTANYEESVSNIFEVKVKIMPVITTVPGIEKTLYAGDSFGSAFLNKDLKGGVVKAAGEVIEGTFAFDETELTRGKPLEAGEHSLKVIFKPEFTYGDKYASTECYVKLNLPKRKFVSVSAWSLDRYVYGTPYSEISMPDSVPVYARGDANDPGIDFGVQTTIEWDSSTYNPYTVKEQTIYGTFDRLYFEKFIEFPEGEEIKAITKITLKPDPADTVITEKPVFRWSKGEFVLEDNRFLLAHTFKLGTSAGGEKGELIGGSARSGDNAVEGTWGFKEGTRTFFNDPGKYEVTVVFTPTNTSLYKPSECKIEITVTKSILARIEPSYDITYQYVGTEFGDLNLPSAVNVYTTDGTFFSGIGVNWDKSTYDKTSSQWQTVIGKLKLDNAPIIQPESGEIKAEMKVKLKSETEDKVTPVITALPVFKWANDKVTLDDNTMFVGKIFKGGSQIKYKASLEGGAAMDGSTVVEGSFLFKEGTSSSFNKIGTQTVTVIFYPNNWSKYNSVETDITVNVIRQHLMSVTDKVVITDKEMGMPFEKLELPELIRQFITTADVAFNLIRVKWDPSGYDPYSTGTQTIYGDIIIGEDFEDLVENSDNVRAVAEITLKPKTVESGDYVIELPYIPAAYIGQSLGDSVFTYFKAKLAETGINVHGTFAFKGKPVLTKDGENEFTVVFTPSDTAYSATEFTIIVHGMKYAVVSVETVIPDVTDKKVGASLSALGLPGKVKVKLDSGDTTELDVTWEGYDPSTTEEQTLTGSLDVNSGEYAVYETEIKAYAKVKLVSDTVAPDVPAFPDKVESYTGSAIEHKIGAFEGLESVKHEYEGIDGTVYAKTETPPVNAGKYRVTATFTMKDGYAAVSPKSATLTIKKAAQDLTAADVNAVYGDTGRKIDVKNAVGALLYTVKSGSEVVTVSSDGALTFAKAGEAYVTVTARGDENRESASVNVKITVSKKNVYITAADKTAYAGESAPSLDSPVYGKDYTVTGLVGDDRLSADVFVLLEYKDTPDMSRGGVFPREYTVVPKIFGEDARYALIAVNGTLTVRAGSGDGDSDKPYIPMPSSYIIKVYESENGAVYVSRSKAFEGDRVTVTVKAKDGYVLDTLTVTDTRGREIKLTAKAGEDGAYVFRMPASRVYVRAEFTEDDTVMNRFTDVTADAPYFDAVIWAVENGVTTGKSDTVFDPMGTCTRAEAVTFLWRSAGSPKPKTSSANMIFDDIAKGSYYYDAVLWAIENGITNGTSETTFSPEKKCSRAHIITFIYRYEKAMGGGMAGEWMFLCPFDDVDANEYYFEPVMWAAASGVALTDDVTVFEVKRAGILDGGEDDEGVLYLPDADCSRAMMVEYLYRYLCLTDER